MIVTAPSGHSCDERRRRVFAGEILRLPAAPASLALAMHARGMIAEALAPHVPEHAQHALDVAEFAARVGALKSRFTNDQRTKELVRDLLAANGCDLQRTWFDVPRLRVVPSGGYLTSGVSYAYKAHRDTWYSSPHAQVNWWMPVFDVAADRAMSFFPAYWDRAVANSSGDFDYGEWCRVGRQLATSQIGRDDRKHPLPLEPVDTTSDMRSVGPTGDLIVFSAAHLHSTAPNESGVTRFSVDFRTLHGDDLDAGAGAPNVDTAARGSTLSDFLRADDFAPIDAGRYRLSRETA